VDTDRDRQARFIALWRAAQVSTEASADWVLTAAMQTKRILRTAVVAIAVPAAFVACSDDDDDNPVEDIGNTVESVVEDVTDDSPPDS
jgi:hypothetical protein